MSFNVDQNVVWEVERVYPLERAAYWWTKPQLKKIRDEYKNEVMMVGVRNLVETRVQLEEVDVRIVDERVEEIMQMDHGSIANFLQSVPTKAEKLLTNYNSNLSSSGDSNLDTDSESDTDSDTDSDSDSDSDSGSESSSSSASSSSSVKEEEREDDHLVRTESSLVITTQPQNSTSNDNDNDALSPSSSENNKDTLSLSSVSPSPQEGLISLQLHDEESEMNETNKNVDDSDRDPKTVDIQPVHETMPSTTLKSESARIHTLEKRKSLQLQTNQLNGNEQTPDKGIKSNPKAMQRKSGRNRFRQGALAVIAVERLREMVKREPPPPSSLQQFLSSSSRLIDMYLPSDDEVDSLLSDEGDSSVCEDVSECPVCLDLVDPGQQRKIILLRRMLCKGCYFSCYINRGGIDERNDNSSKVSKQKCGEAQPHEKDALNFDTKRDVQILNSLKRCISSTNKSPMVPVLPMQNSKATMLRDEIYVNSEGKAGQNNGKAGTLRRKKSSAAQGNSEKPRSRKK